MSKDAFSTREIEVLAFAWRCMDTEPKIDYEKLAQIAGYGSRGSAATVFGNIRRKLKTVAAGESTPASTPKKSASTKNTPKSNGKRGASTPDFDDETPTKKVKKGSKRDIRERNNYDDDEEQFGNVKIKEDEETDVLSSLTDRDSQLSIYGAGVKHNRGEAGYSDYSNAVDFDGSNSSLYDGVQVGYTDNGNGFSFGAETAE